MRSIIKLITFSLLPAILFFVTAETSVRLIGIDKPSIIAGGSGIGQPGSISKADPELGWSLIPNTTINTPEGAVTINNLGLRSPEIFPKKKNEFRILSLGESSTFGTDVSDSETYSAQLQELLNKIIQSRIITVINTGVSAYSSFQSLKYLESRGLRLKPDLILFYHEVNDYLPSAVHDAELNEIGILKTDKQLYDSFLQKINRILEQKSGFFRFLAYSYAQYRINKINREDFKNPIFDIGLPDLRIGSRFYTVPSKILKATVKLNPLSLGRRVSEDERLENFKKLFSICNDHKIELIIIHPSYRYSKPHECLLTRFCFENNVLMFEAYHSLHPESFASNVMFLDYWHPTPYGHKCLATDLARFICCNIFKEECESRILNNKPYARSITQPNCIQFTTTYRVDK